MLMLVKVRWKVRPEAQGPMMKITWLVGVRYAYVFPHTHYQTLGGTPKYLRTMPYVQVQL